MTRQKIYNLVASCTPSQDFDEMTEFLMSLSPIAFSTCLDIGIHMGGTYRIWRNFFLPELLIGIDTDENTHYYLDGLTNEHILCPMSSRDKNTVNLVKRLLGGRQLDFIFIDGDHSYEGVRADFEIYKEFCGPGSVIAFHDVCADRVAGEVEVVKYWNEIKGDYNTKEFMQGKTGIGAIYL